MAISIVSIPLLIAIFAFYKWVFAYLSTKRLSKKDVLYQENRLYWISEITANTRTSANINSIFSICLLCSIMSLIFGMLMLSGDTGFWTLSDSKWMGFMQISICIIFMVIYFSILSLLQIIELKKQARRIQILQYMGKSKTELRNLMQTQIRIKLLLPTIMSFMIVLGATPLVNYKLNRILPVYLHNFLLIAVSWFIICFVVLYFCYYHVTYIISKHYIKF